jgi:NADPH:quinone reductase-like Zn-dependent oxidoreductase
MKKIVIHKPGDYQQLKIEDFPDPVPLDTEVLIKVSFIGINYADVVIRWGVYKSAKDYVGWPITPGFEVSGYVEKVGKNVTRFKCGDKVFGVTRFGGYTSHLSVDENFVFKLPHQLTLEQGAAFPAVYLTAYHALFQNIIIRKGARLLIHSCAGGVGSALLQLSRYLQLETTGVVGSTHKIDVAKKFGALHVIDKSKQDLWKEAERISPEGFDVILDANGASTLYDSYLHLASSGKLLCYGFHSMLPKTGGKLNYPQLIWTFLKTPRFNPLDMTSDNKSVIAFNLSYLFERKDLFIEAIEQMVRLLEEGFIVGPETTTYDFEKVGEAHKALESGKTSGKLVLAIRNIM